MFNERILISQYSSSVRSINTVDLDNDGDLDMIATFDWNNPSILRFMNNGHGDFSPGAQLASDDDIYWSSQAEDIDGDGDIDIISGGTNELFLHENLGDLNFADPVIIDLVSFVRDIEVQDMDGDGDLDLAIASEPGLQWYKNEGNSNFDPAPEYLLNSSPLDPMYSIKLEGADLDGDGDKDMAALIQNPNRLSWFENLGNGNWSEEIAIMEIGNPIQLLALDIDNDEDIDLVTASSTDSRIRWFENNGEGEFISSNTIDNDADQVSDITMYDIDGDDDLDLISSLNGSIPHPNGIHVYVNTGSQNFADPYELPRSNPDNLNFAIGDLNGDGTVDLIAGETAGSLGRLFWFSNIGDTSFSDQKRIAPLVGVNTYIGAHDMDQDGDQDILIGANESGANDFIGWLENVEFGSDYYFHSIVADDRINGGYLSAGDLNSDGYPDIAYCINSPGICGWIANDGNGNFLEEDTIAFSGSFNKSIALEDMDSDGDLDILYQLPSPKWYENLGSGNFTDDAVFTNINAGVEIELGHINDDEFIDIVVASLDNIEWYSNLGDGNVEFENEVSALIDYPRSLQIRDLDGDGDMDIFSTSSEDNKVAWYKNDGMENFGNQIIISTMYDSPYGATLEDFDNDGQADVVVSFLEGYIIWFRNIGNGEFEETEIIDNLIPEAALVSPIDVNNDNDLDLIGVGRELNHIYLYTNSTILSSTADSFFDDVFISPNPVTSQARINIMEGLIVKQISLFDLSGKQLASEHFQILEEEIVINRGNLDRGMYLVQILTDQGDKTIKLAIR